MRAFLLETQTTLGSRESRLRLPVRVTATDWRADVNDHAPEFQNVPYTLEVDEVSSRALSVKAQHFSRAPSKLTNPNFTLICCAINNDALAANACRTDHLPRNPRSGQRQAKHSKLGHYLFHSRKFFRSIRSCCCLLLLSASILLLRNNNNNNNNKTARTTKKKQDTNC